MELNVFNKKAYEKIEGFRIATGVVAVLSAVCLVYHTILTLYYNGIIYMLSLLAMITAMVVLAIYVFIFYGKKQSLLLGVSAASLALAELLSSIYDILIIRSDYIFSEKISRGYVINFISCTVISGIFILIALKYFKKVNINIKALPIIAIAIAFFTSIIDSRIFGYFSLIVLIFELLYLVPFLLFILFCPPTYKRVKINALNSQIKEQEMLIGDLNFQLIYLKNEFENGRITQQEYDYKRKSLIDKL